MARPELGRRGGHYVKVGVEDDAEMWPVRAAVDERAGFAAGLELLHREPGPGEIHHEIKRFVQVTGSVRGRAHGEQLARRSKERLKIHHNILTRAGPPPQLTVHLLTAIWQCPLSRRTLQAD